MKERVTKNLNSIGVRDGVGGQGQYRVGRGSIGWAGAVLGGQGQYWVGRGSIGCYTTKSQIFGILNNLCKMLFLLVEPKKLI